MLSDRRAGVVQFVQHQLQVLRVDTGDRDVTAGHRRRDPPRRGDDAVTDHPVLGRMHTVDAMDRHRRGSGA
jgi:hypothetical protein